MVIQVNGIWRAVATIVTAPIRVIQGVLAR